MTAKRFEYYEHKGADYILDTPNKSLDFIEMLGDCLEAEEIVDLLNELHEENEQLKTQLQNTSDQRDEFHRGARENANHIGKLEKENEQLKQDNNALIHLLENQSMIIQELHSKLLEYQIQEPIVLTKEDLELMGKAISYYTHGRYAE